MAEQDYTQNRIFIHNTLSVLRQYEIHKEIFEKNYSHTLFLNTCIGLLIIPKESVLDDLPTIEVDENEWGINPMLITVSTRADKSIKNIARELRNAIAHNNFRYDYNEDNPIPINHISINNRDGQFCAELPFENFKKFVMKLSDKTLEILNMKIGTSR